MATMSVGSCVDSKEEDAQGHLMVVAALQGHAAVARLAFLRMSSGQHGHVCMKGEESRAEQSRGGDGI